jgi:hypothetical protein
VVGLVALNYILWRFLRGVTDVALEFGVLDVICFVMTPLTRPASEFQRMWSPTLNVFGIAIILFQGSAKVGFGIRHDPA